MESSQLASIFDWWWWWCLIWYEFWFYSKISGIVMCWKSIIIYGEFLSILMNKIVITHTMIMKRKEQLRRNRKNDGEEEYFLQNFSLPTTCGKLLYSLYNCKIMWIQCLLDDSTDLEGGLNRPVFKNLAFF